jgi:hypothetical protein
MVRTWIDALPQKTCRSLDDWLRLIEKQGPPGEQERRNWLNAEHGLGTNQALWMAARSVGKGREDSDP